MTETEIREKLAAVGITLAGDHTVNTTVIGMNPEMIHENGVVVRFHGKKISNLRRRLSPETLIPNISEESKEILKKRSASLNIDSWTSKAIELKEMDNAYSGALRPLTDTRKSGKGSSVGFQLPEGGFFVFYSDFEEVVSAFEKEQRRYFDNLMTFLNKYEYYKEETEVEDSTLF